MTQVEDVAIQAMAEAAMKVAREADPAVGLYFSYQPNLGDDCWCACIGNDDPELQSEPLYIATAATAGLALYNLLIEMGFTLPPYKP